MTERPIKLLQLVHGYPPAIGGVELSVRDRCERLVADFNFDVSVLTTDALSVARFWDHNQPTIPIEDGEEQNGVKITRFPVRTRFAPVLRVAQSAAYRFQVPGNDLLRTLYHGPICPGMARAVHLAKADVISAAAFPLNHMRYPFRVREPRPPIVLVPSIHTNDPWGFDRPNLLRLVNRSFATVASTDHEREWLLEHGADPARVRVIAHGIDPGELQPKLGAFRAEHGVDRDGYLVAYVGQQGEHKGIDVLIDVFPRLLALHPNAWLAIGGGRTPFSFELIRQIDLLSPEARARIRLIDDLSPQAKADLLGDCNVFASPSRFESFGVTTLEAWSVSKPVVVGDSPSQSFIVEEGKSGHIVRHGDRDQLLQTLARLASPDLQKALGRAGHERLVAHYRRSDVEAKHAELLIEAAQSRASRGPGVLFSSPSAGQAAT